MAPKDPPLSSQGSGVRDVGVTSLHPLRPSLTRRQPRLPARDCGAREGSTEDGPAAQLAHVATGRIQLLTGHWAERLGSSRLLARDGPRLLAVRPPPSEQERKTSPRETGKASGVGVRVPLWPAVGHDMPSLLPDAIGYKQGSRWSALGGRGSHRGLSASRQRSASGVRFGRPAV